MLNIALIQFIAYFSFTLASVCIAVVSAIFGYRQNYGWKPIVITTTHGVSGIGGSDTYNATLKFEFWNRRKYPVTITASQVKFATLEFKYIDDRKGWHRVGNGFHRQAEGRIEPSSHREIEFAAPFQKRSLDDLEDTITVTVTYFDPVSEKYKVSSTRRRFSFK